MNFSIPTPEPQAWDEMLDSERRAFFGVCLDHQPVDFSSFSQMLDDRRKGLTREPMGESFTEPLAHKVGAITCTRPAHAHVVAYLENERLTRDSMGEAKILSPQEFDQAQKLAWAQVEADVYHLRS